MDPFDIFLENLSENGLEFFRKFYGVYRAEVVDVNDEEKRGRIRVICYDVGHSSPLDQWVDPAFAGAGTDHGLFWPPEVGDSVWVVFDAGDPSIPLLYWGGWFGAPDDKSDVPQELGYVSDAPEKRGLVTRSGHVVVFSDESGKESVKVQWKRDPKTYLEMDKDGSVTVSAKDGATVKLDAAGGKIEVKDANSNSIVLENGKLTVKGASEIDVDAPTVNIRSPSVTLGKAGSAEPLIKGRTLYQWLLTHTHVTSTGTSTPPLVPLPATVLSTQVKTK